MRAAWKPKAPKPPHTFAADEPHDVLVNQDGFPQINEAYALGYLQAAQTRVRHAFYSINQESRARQVGTVRQSTVADLVAKAGGLRRVSRHRHWLRAGYVEETYRRGDPVGSL